MSGCATPTPAGSDAMSSISEPTSAGSYTEADVAARLGLAADCADYFKVKQISELLRSKGVKPQGKKAQKCKQVALVCTEDEVRAFRQAKEAEALAALAAAKKQKREPGQLTINETVKRMRARCTHDFVRVLPSGPRDNGEHRDVCRLCAAVRE